MAAQKVDVDEIESVLWDADIDEESLYREYSGRYMYGSHCFGIVGDAGDYGRFIAHLTKRNEDLALDLALNVTTDNMGRDMIYYFPGFQLAKEDDDAGE